MPASISDVGGPPLCSLKERRITRPDAGYKWEPRPCNSIALSWLAVPFIYENLVGNAE
jgi:hypothetical protein